MFAILLAVVDDPAADERILHPAEQTARLSNYGPDGQLLLAARQASKPGRQPVVAP